MLPELLREHYGLAATELTGLGGSDNDVYRVDVPGLPRHLLRVQRGFQPGEDPAAHAAFEFDWLRHLLRAGVRVPEPVDTREGTPFVALPGGDLALLFRWVEGEHLPFPEPRAACACGRALAKLHDASRGFHPTLSCKTRWDEVGLLGPSSWFARHAERDLDATALATVRFAAEQVEGISRELGRTERYYGVIHSDPHHENMISHGDRDDDDLGFVDTAECGYGYYAFDLATLLHEWMDRPAAYPALAEALLAGYGEVAELPLQRNEQLDACVAARILAWFAWELRSDDARARQDALTSDWLPALLAQLERFRTTGRFITHS